MIERPGHSLYDGGRKMKNCVSLRLLRSQANCRKHRMILILAVFFYLVISVVVVWGSIYINGNLGVDESAYKLTGSNNPRVFLRTTPVKRGPGHFARSFLSFRERHDTVWEIIEASMIAAVFVLLFLGLEEQEYLVSLISHVLVGILLVLKFTSLGAFWWAQHHSPGHGLD
jgi:hypothetical protein